jgi:hypothetical protein
MITKILFVKLELPEKNRTNYEYGIANPYNSTLFTIEKNDYIIDTF